MLSVILPTMHPGGMDFVAESFCKGHPSWDYELLLVDDWPGRSSKGIVEKYLKMRGVKLGWYGNSKPKDGSTVCGWVNAVNTALSHARGDYVVIMQDYTTLTYDWFLRWHIHRQMKEKKFGHRRFLSSGTAVMYVAPKPQQYDDLLSWPGQPEIWAQKFNLIYHPWVPEKFETFYWGFPMEFIEEINGFDERCDHCGPWINNSVLFQAEQLKYEVVVELGCVCMMVDHREWNDPDNERHPYNANSKIGMWKIEGEWRSLSEEPEWTCPSSNPFSMKDLRAQNSERK